MMAETDTSRYGLCLVLHFLLSVAILNDVFLPHHHDLVNDAENATANGSSISAAHDIPDHHDTIHYKLATYLGLGFGSIVAGLAGYWLDCPKTLCRFLARVVVLTGLLFIAVAHRGNMSLATEVTVRFTKCAANIGFFLVNYTYTMESVPDSWRLAVGLAGYGLSWSLSRLVSLLLPFQTTC